MRGWRARARGTAAPIAWMSGGVHSGPVILGKRTGKPSASEKFARRFREVVWAAGASDAICNMDAQPLAVTDP